MRVFPILFILTLPTVSAARELTPPATSYGACVEMKEEAKRKACFDALLSGAATEALTPLPPPTTPEPLPPPRRGPAPEAKTPPALAPVAPPPVAEPNAPPPPVPPPPPEKTKGRGAPAPLPPQRAPETKPAVPMPDTRPPELKAPEANAPRPAAGPRVPASADPASPADPPPAAAAPPRSEAPPPAPAAEPSGAQLVPAEEMVRTPAKFRGKYVEMRRMRCFYAEKDDFRCTATTLDAAVIVVAPSVRPAAAQRTIEQACADMRSAAVSPSCQVTIRFTPAGVGEDKVGGLAKRAVVAAPEVEIAPE